MWAGGRAGCAGRGRGGPAAGRSGGGRPSARAAGTGDASRGRARSRARREARPTAPARPGPRGCGAAGAGGRGPARPALARTQRPVSPARRPPGPGFPPRAAALFPAAGPRSRNGGAGAGSGRGRLGGEARAGGRGCGPARLPLDLGRRPPAREARAGAQGRGRGWGRPRPGSPGALRAPGQCCPVSRRRRSLRERPARPRFKLEGGLEGDLVLPQTELSEAPTKDGSPPGPTLLPGVGSPPPRLGLEDVRSRSEVGGG